MFTRKLILALVVIITTSASGFAYEIGTTLHRSDEILNAVAAVRASNPIMSEEESLKLDRIEALAKLRARIPRPEDAWSIGIKNSK